MWTHCRRQDQAADAARGREALSPCEAESREIQKMENRGNEAKKYLKTKENGFFECCKLRAFWARIRTNRTLKGAKTARHAQHEPKLPHRTGGRTRTDCRLVLSRISQRLACRRRKGGASAPPPIKPHPQVVGVGLALPSRRKGTASRSPTPALVMNGLGTASARLQPLASSVTMALRYALGNF